MRARISPKAAKVFNNPKAARALREAMRTGAKTLNEGGEVMFSFEDSEKSIEKKNITMSVQYAKMNN